jgi:glycine/D-amino acid oxidase-like deaminating enzyme
MAPTPTRFTRSLVFACSLLLLPPAIYAQSLSADEKELAAYTLTMPTVKKVMQAAMLMAEEEARDPKVQERTKLKAQIEALQAKDELTEAQQAELDKLQERLEALEAADDAEESPLKNPKSLAEMEAAIKAHPGALRAMQTAGITPREFARCMMAMLQAALVEGFSQGKADLKTLPAGINPENVKFVREHKAELEAMQKAMAGKK